MCGTVVGTFSELFGNYAEDFFGTFLELFWNFVGALGKGYGLTILDVWIFLELFDPKSSQKVQK